MQFDPVKLELFYNLFVAVTEEMGAVLQYSSLSSNIRDRRDFSTAMFNPNGEMIAQGAHIPVHLGSMPASVKAAISLDISVGDIVILNDPYSGGTHLPDITLVAPVYHSDQLIGYVANRAHHADVGGIKPGSMAITSSIYQEGLIIPPVFLVKNGCLQTSVMELIKSNSRAYLEREGDINAQIASINIGIQRLTQYAGTYTAQELITQMNNQLDYTETYIKNRISQIPHGSYYSERAIEDDGSGNSNLMLRCSLNVSDTLTADLSESCLQTSGCLNAPVSVTMSAFLYCLIAVIGGKVLPNAGATRCFILKTKPGTLIDAQSPAACAGGNVETSQRLVDLFLACFAQALPECAVAESQGTMNNITLGFNETRTYYETIGGGCGASAVQNGASALHSHMTNSLNTPVEIIEKQYPILVNGYSIREESGGKGIHFGGNGLERIYQILEPAECSLLTERRKFSPQGIESGSAAQLGKILLIHEGELTSLPSKGNINLVAGDILIVQTPGGGGWGKPVS